MKEATKELIEWIKESLPTGFPNYRQKAIYFLDSLPGIESHLCRGGYIQDKNGTPCCHNDEVLFESFLVRNKGILKWDSVNARFVIICYNNTTDNDIYPISQIDWFRKVEP